MVKEILTNCFWIWLKSLRNLANPVSNRACSSHVHSFLISLTSEKYFSLFLHAFCLPITSDVSRTGLTLLSKARFFNGIAIVVTNWRLLNGHSLTLHSGSSLIYYYDVIKILLSFLKLLFKSLILFTNSRSNRNSSAISTCAHSTDLSHALYFPI